MLFLVFFGGGPFDTFVSISFGVRKTSISLETRKIGTDICFVRSVFKPSHVFFARILWSISQKYSTFVLFFSPYISEKNKVTGFVVVRGGFCVVINGG